MEDGKLSDRVRAGSECAPWVVEEIKTLESALSAARERIREMGVGVARPKGPILDLHGDPLHGISLTMFRRGWDACAEAALRAANEKGEGA